MNTREIFDVAKRFGDQTSIDTIEFNDVGLEQFAYAIYNLLNNFIDTDLSEIYQDLDVCPGCGGPADNGFDRCFPPSPYNCTKCTPDIK